MKRIALALIVAVGIGLGGATSAEAVTKSYGYWYISSYYSGEFSFDGGTISITSNPRADHPTCEPVTYVIPQRRNDVTREWYNAAPQRTINQCLRNASAAWYSLPPGNYRIMMYDNNPAVGARGTLYVTR